MRHTRIYTLYAYVTCVYAYTYNYAYWDDVNYAYILVQIYPSCTTYRTVLLFRFCYSHAPIWCLFVIRQVAIPKQNLLETPLILAFSAYNTKMEFKPKVKKISLVNTLSCWFISLFSFPLST